MSKIANTVQCGVYYFTTQQTWPVTFSGNAGVVGIPTGISNGYWVVYPGFKLESYTSSNYGGTMLSINNIGGTQIITGQTLNITASVKIFFVDTTNSIILT